METFSALLDICARNSPVPGEVPAQRPMTRSFDIFFHFLGDLRRYLAHYDVIVMVNIRVIHTREVSSDAYWSSTFGIDTGYYTEILGAKVIDSLPHVILKLLNLQNKRCH